MLVSQIWEGAFNRKGDIWRPLRESWIIGSLPDSLMVFQPLPANGLCLKVPMSLLWMPPRTFLPTRPPRSSSWSAGQTGVNRLRRELWWCWAIWFWGRMSPIRWNYVISFSFTTIQSFNKPFSPCWLKFLCFRLCISWIPSEDEFLNAHGITFINLLLKMDKSFVLHFFK